MGKRLDYLDMTKGFGIILVVMGHIIYTEAHVMVWISSFHMPLFFVVAGVLMAVKNEDHSDPLAVIRHKAKGLLIPYFWFSLIDFVLDIGNVTLGKIDMHTFQVNAISSLTLYGKSVLWFLTALFFTSCYFVLLRSKLSDKVVPVMVVLIAAACYFLRTVLENIYIANADNLLITSIVNFLRSFVRAGMVLPFLAGGYYIWRWLIGKMAGFTDDRPGKKIRTIRVMSAIVLFAVNITAAMVNWSVDTNNMVFGNIFLYYIGGFAGSFAVIMLMRSIPPVKPLSYLGRNSLIIMATHLDCYLLWAGLRVGLIIYGLVPLAPVLIIFTVVITLLLDCIVIEVINRFFPFIIGKKRKA